MQAMLEPKQSPETIGFNKAWLNDMLKKGMSCALHYMLSNPVSRFKKPQPCVSGSDGCRAQATSGGRQAWRAKEPGRRTFLFVQAGIEQFAVLRSILSARLRASRLLRRVKAAAQVCTARPHCRCAC